MKTIIKNFLPVILLTLLISITVNGQGITIGKGTTLTLGGSTTLSLTGNWTDNGTFTAGTGSTVTFDGSSGNETISGAETFDNLTINKTAGNVVLSNNIVVNGTVTCTSGDLNLNGKTFTLGSSGMVSETSGHEVMGGTITETRTLNAPSSDNVGGLGAEITSTANLGSTTIKRGSAVQTGASNNGIKRYYDITPTTDTGLNATLVFHYNTADLNGLTESTLSLYKSTDNGATWTNEGGHVNTINHFVLLSGINSFSRWTLGSTAAPLPVELVSFAAEVLGSQVHLSWKTATEVNNYGFDVERSNPPLNPLPRGEVKEWTKIGFVSGHGNSNTPNSYTFTDANMLNGKEFYYRLKQIDVNGKFVYSDILTVKLNLPDRTQLMQNSPNPFNPSTSIKYFIPKQADVIIKIYDMLGREVTTLIDNKEGAGYHITFWNGRDKYGQSVSSGVYLYRLTAVNTISSFSKTKKMTLLK